MIKNDIIKRDNFNVVCLLHQIIDRLGLCD